MSVGLLTDRSDNKLKRSNLINEHALNREPLPFILSVIVNEKLQIELKIQWEFVSYPGKVTLCSVFESFQNTRWEFQDLCENLQGYVVFVYGKQQLAPFHQEVDSPGDLVMTLQDEF